MAQPNLKVALAADLDRARARLARNLDSLHRDLDVPAHLKHSFHHNKAAYIGGATLFGLLLSKLPARRKKIYVERKSGGLVKDAEKAGLWLVLLQFLFKALRPMLASLITRQAAAFLKSRYRSQP